MMDYWMLILQLFGTFFVIGMFTFGGGYAIMSLIQSEIVINRGWISESAFTDIAAISQMTPGPIGLNCSTYVGYEVGGVLGSAVASIAIVLPSFIIMLLIVKCYLRFQRNPVFGNVMESLKPAVAGLIGAAAIGLMFTIGADGISILAENFPDWKSWVIFAAALAASLLTRIGPIATLAGAAALGFILYF
ncbi:MAG: chromate transporter [Bacteroidales bacterium]|nr:chromate transporter [Bacteroidales bacterium]